MLNVTVFGNVTPCNLLDNYQCFEETFSLNFEVRTLNMDVVDFSGFIK